MFHFPFWGTYAMSWTDSNGAPVETPRQDMRDDVTKGRIRGLMMVALHKQGWSLREIAEFFSGRWYHTQVRRLLDQTSESIKAQESMDRCGPDGSETA